MSHLHDEKIKFLQKGVSAIRVIAIFAVFTGVVMVAVSAYFLVPNFFLKQRDAWAKEAINKYIQDLEVLCRTNGGFENYKRYIPTNSKYENILPLKVEMNCHGPGCKVGELFYAMKHDRRAPGEISNGYDPVFCAPESCHYTYHLFVGCAKKEFLRGNNLEEASMIFKKVEESIKFP